MRNRDIDPNGPIDPKWNDPISFETVCKIIIQKYILFTIELLESTFYLVFCQLEPFLEFIIFSMFGWGDSCLLVDGNKSTNS